VARLLYYGILQLTESGIGIEIESYQLTGSETKNSIVQRTGMVTEIKLLRIE